MKATPVIVVGAILAGAAILATAAGAQISLLPPPSASPGVQSPPPAPLPQARDTGPPPIIAATSPERGQGLFQQRCAGCHDPAVGVIPSRADLARIKPEDIVAAMKTGDMRQPADGLSDVERLAVAAYLTAH